MGVKYPAGDSPFFPPKDWSCPSCTKYHSKPHFAWPGQVDESKNPQDVGRVVFNRANKNGDDSLDYSQTVKKNLIGKQAPMISEDGLVQGMFCPHCGWLEHIINIIQEAGFIAIKGWRSIAAPKCCIKGCKAKARYKKNKVNFCVEHYKLVK